MDIDQKHFYPRLLGVLRSMADASYIAIDLEMSGISMRDANTLRPPGRPNLEAQYADTKAAAERYTILQLGLTCIIPDHKRSKESSLTTCMSSSTADIVFRCLCGETIQFQCQPTFPCWR